MMQKKKVEQPSQADEYSLGSSMTMFTQQRSFLSSGKSSVFKNKREEVSLSESTVFPELFLELSVKAFPSE